MAVDLLLFVSKRASVAAAALLCLAAGRLAVTLADAAPPTAPPSEVRVGIGR